MAKAGDKKLMVVLIILFVVAFGVIVALCYYRWNDNKKLEQEVDSIQARIGKMELIKAEISDLRQERRRSIEAINDLTKILPTEAETSHSDLLELLRQFATASGVSVTSLLRPTEVPEPGMPIMRYKYEIMVEGTFPQFVRFLNHIERHERFLKVDSFEVANLGTGPIWPETPEKKMRLRLTTYTYNPE